MKHVSTSSRQPEDELHPNDPSNGPETGARAEHGDAEHGRAGSGATDRPNDTEAGPGQGPSQATAPR